jgi:hypothetical protein
MEHKMKKIILSLAALVLVACGGNSNAATLPQIFKANTAVGTSTVVAFTINHAASVKFGGGQVLVIYADMNSSYVPNLDPTGTVKAAVMNDAYFQANFVYNAITDTYYNMAIAKSVICNGNQTTVRSTTGAGYFINDNCTLFNSVIARANQ